MDRLSTLNDDLLSLIFSFLPVKDAVRTAALSRRWRHVPSLLPRRDSLRLLRTSPAPLAALPGLLRRCLILRPARASPAAVDRLLRAAVDRGVHELALHDRSRSRPRRAPSRVLAAPSLRVLSLTRCSLDNTPRVALPFLRTLKLERVSLCEMLLSLVLSSCTLLERLHIVYCGGVGAYSISSASVRHLWIQPTVTVWEIQVDAPSLDTLILYTRPRVRILSLRGAKVRKAFLHLARPLREITRALEKFLAAAEGLNCLTLRGASLKCLSLGKKHEAFPIPFQKLRIFSLSVDMKDDLQVSYIVKLLGSFPHLRELNISITQGRLTVASTHFEEHEKRLRQLKCITHHLEQVKLSCVCDSTSEVNQIKLARLFLTKAKKLKKMTLQLPKNCSSDRLTAAKDLLSSSKKASIQRTCILSNCHCLQIELA